MDTMILAQYCCRSFDAYTLPGEDLFLCTWKDFVILILKIKKISHAILSTQIVLRERERERERERDRER